MNGWMDEWMDQYLRVSRVNSASPNRLIGEGRESRAGVCGSLLETRAWEMLGRVWRTRLGGWVALL